MDSIQSLPKSMQGSKQHTFVEIGNLRYLYTPMEELYLVIVGTKGNILEEMEVLRVLKNCVQAKLEGGGESAFRENAFDILMMVDDVVSFQGREAVSKEQVHEYLLMQSTEEKLNRILRVAKEVFGCKIERGQGAGEKVHKGKILAGGAAIGAGAGRLQTRAGGSEATVCQGSRASTRPQQVL